MTLTEFAELVGAIKDIALIVVSLLLTFLLLGILFLYRKLSRLLDSATRTVESAEQIADVISGKLARPVGAGSGIAFGLGKAVAFFGGFRHKKKGKGEKDNG